MEKPSFSITAKCRSGVGAGEAVPCQGDGRAFHLKGCLPAACTSPRRDPWGSEDVMRFCTSLLGAAVFWLFE